MAVLKHKKINGFSLIETLTAVSILTAIFSIAIAVFTNSGTASVPKKVMAISRLNNDLITLKNQDFFEDTVWNNNSFQAIYTFTEIKKLKRVNFYIDRTNSTTWIDGTLYFDK